jgi:peptidoglycan hydrolase-like protein with peptidoglycan-binding domain
MGSTGPDVIALQLQLNAIFPDQNPSLKIDGIFGPRTLARVQFLQRTAGLSPDGIVGPLTFAAIAQLAPTQRQADGSPTCSTGDPRNIGHVQNLVAAAGPQAFANPAPAAFAPASVGSTSFGLNNPIPSSLRHLTVPEEVAARKVFNNSLDFTKIFISNAVGPTGRPFTAAVNVPFLSFTAVQILNLGPTFSNADLIHELTHAWQSQHHSDPKFFMASCLACQSAAAAVNAAIAVQDPNVMSNDDFPANFPVSAYSFKPNQGFDNYGGEQIAQQVQLGRSEIISHVASLSVGVVDASNGHSLSHMRNFEDTRIPGVLG